MALAAHSGFIASQLTTEFAVVETYTELYNGNATLVASITDDNVMDIVQIIKKEHNGLKSFGDDFVQLLSILCICNDTPLPQNQARIFKSFLVENFNLIAGVDKRGQELWLTYKNGQVQLQLEKMQGQYRRIVYEHGAATPGEILYAYYVRCMQLYFALLEGRNHDVEDFFMDHADEVGLGYHTLLWSLSAPRVPWAVKTLSCQLLLALYIDRDPLQPRLPIQLVRCLPRYQHIWQDSSDESADLFKNYAQHRPEANFVTLKNVVLEYVRGLNGKFADSSEQNSLTSNIAVTAHNLVRFGFFHDKGLPRVQDKGDVVGMSSFIEPLMALLDGRREARAFGGTRFRYNEANEPIVKTKKLICDIVSYVISCCTELMVQSLFEQYDILVDVLEVYPEAHDDPMLCLISKAKVEPFITALESVKSLSNAFIDLKSSKDDQSCEFCYSMLDLCQYEYVPLVINAFTLLTQFFGRQDEAVRVMIQTQIVSSESDARCNVKIMHDIIKLSGACRWIAASSASPEKMEAISESLEMVRSIDLMLNNAFERDDGSLTSYQMMLTNLGTIDILLKILENPIPQTSSKHSLESGIIAEYFEHYDLDQSGTIGLSTELPQLVMNLVIKFKLKLTTKQLDEKIKHGFPDGVTEINLVAFSQWYFREFLCGEETKKGTHRQLVSTCYQLLASLSKRNPSIQKKLMSHWKLFKGHLKYEDLCSAQAMAAVLDDNEDLHDNLPEDEIRSICKLLCDDHCVDWVLLLQSMVWLTELKRRHPANSQTVSMMIAFHPNMLTFMGPGVPPLDVSKVVSGEIGTGEAHYHVEIVRLIVMTCEGKSEACEVRAQSFMSYEHAIEVLLHCINVLEQDSASSVKNKMSKSVLFAVLHLRAIYLHFVFEVFVDAGSTTGSGLEFMFEHGLWQIPVTLRDDLPYGKSAFRDTHTTLDRFLMLTRSSAANPLPTDVLPEYDSLHRFVYDIAIPMLHGYYSSHHRESVDGGGDITQKFVDSLVNLRQYASPQQDQLISRCLKEMESYAVVSWSQVRSVYKEQMAVQRGLVQTLWKVTLHLCVFSSY